MWNLDESIYIVRSIEHLAIKFGYHCALGGSVLLKGYSIKDLDIIIFEHKKGQGLLIPFCDELKNYVTNWRLRDHTEYNDTKIVYACDYTIFGITRRIDFIFA